MGGVTEMQTRIGEHRRAHERCRRFSTTLGQMNDYDSGYPKGLDLEEELRAQLTEAWNMVSTTIPETVEDLAEFVGHVQAMVATDKTLLGPNLTDFAEAFEGLVSVCSSFCGRRELKARG